MGKVYKLNPATGQKEWVESTGSIKRMGGSPENQFSGEYSFTKSDKGEFIPSANNTIETVSGEKVRRYTTPYESAVSGLTTDFTQSDEDKIRQNVYSRNQGVIDSINEGYKNEVLGIQKQGQESLGRQRAITSRSGLLGSARGNTQRENVIGSIKEEERLAEANRQAKIQDVLFKLDSRASEEIAAKRAEVQGNREAYLNFLKDQTTNAREQIKELAGLGVTMDELSPEDVADLEKYSGYNSLTLNSLWNASLPKEDQIDYQYEITDAGQVLAYGVNPLTGELTVKKHQLDVPLKLDTDEKITDVGGTPMIVRTENGMIVSARPVSDLTGEQTGGLTETGKTILDQINKLLDSNINAIAGVPGVTKFIPGTDAQEAKNLWESIKANLSLENRQKLKGSGAISDFEARVLENASKAGLDTNLSNTKFREGLEEMRDALLEKQGEGGGKNYSSLDDYYERNPDEQENIDSLINQIYKDNPDATDEEIEDAVIKVIDPSMKNFKSVGNTSASIQIPKTARLAYVNNNPGNLKYAGQRGAVKGEKGFAKFESPEAGFNALIRQVQLDQNRDLTLSQFIHKFAPPTENNTALYIAQLEKLLGIKKGDKIKNVDAQSLAKAVAKKESSSTFT